MCLVVHLMPEQNLFSIFQNVKYQTPAPFVMYGDLQFLLHLIETQCAKTHRLQHNEPCAAAAIFLSKYSEIKNRTFIDSGEFALDNFLEWLLQQEKMILNFLRQNRLMNALSIEEYDRFLKAN